MMRVLLSIVLAFFCFGFQFDGLDDGSGLPADRISVNTDNFDRNLSILDDDLQKALNTLDDGASGVNWEDPDALAMAQSATGWTSDGSTKTTTALNVGINSTAPRAGLDVAGDIYVDTLHYTTLDPAIDVTISTATQTTITGILRGNGSTIEADTTVYLSEEADTLATVTGRGAVTTTNVGIGSTATPTNALKVTGNADFTGLVGIGTPNPSVKLQVVPTSDFVLGSGGTESNIVFSGANYRLHAYTSIGSSTFTAPRGVSNIRILVIGGGGNGTNRGGGGAGGMIDKEFAITPGATYNLSVGGAATNSTFDTLTAYAGGNGAYWSNGGDGGSGGGSGCGPSGYRPYVGGLATQPPSESGGYGYQGGPCWTDNQGGGGGGAGGIGGTATGGVGRYSDITGVNTCYAGGGGGAIRNGGTATATCGGGAGWWNGGNNGTANTGGGGGGFFGVGGSGVIYIAYQIPALPTSIVAGGSIGINTTDIGALLDIKGTGDANASTSFRIRSSVDTTRFVVFDGGLVGINTVSPTTNLEVNGNAKINGYLIGNIGIGTQSPYSSLGVTLGTYTPLTAMLYNSNTAPQFPRMLENIVAPVSTNDTTVATGAVSGLNLENSSPTNSTFSPYLTWSRRSASGSYNSVYASIAGYATGNGADTNWVAGDLVFGTAASQGPLERMRITAAGLVGIGTTAPRQALEVTGSGLFSGNVGIGTSVPLVKLEVAGTVSSAVGSSANPSYSFTGDLDTGLFHPDANIVAVSTNALERMRVDASGNVGIGTTTPTKMLSVADACIQLKSPDGSLSNCCVDNDNAFTCTGL